MVSKAISNVSGERLCVKMKSTHAKHQVFLMQILKLYRLAQSRSITLIKKELSSLLMIDYNQTNNLFLKIKFFRA